MIIIASLKDIICTGVIRCLNKVYASEFIGKLTGNADTATNSDKLDGYHGSSGQSANTYVLRDSNGYVFTNYINSNTSDNENPTISQIIVTNGADNYYRKASLAHLKSSLGSMPASDVYAWAKASSKPSYSYSEISGTPSSLPANGGTSTYANNVWTQSHNGSWYINSNWNGTYFITNAKSTDGSTLPIWVNNSSYADSAGNADTLDGNHASAFATASHTHNYAPSSGSNNYVRVWNSCDVGTADNLSINDLAKQHFSMAMVNNATDNPQGGKYWNHVINMSWNNGVNTSWCSQIALGVDSSDGMWYRTTKGTIVGASWKRVLDSSNYKSYCTPANIGAAASSHTHSYAGSSSAGGSATSAVKLDSSAGSATQPVYFSGGKPVACSYTLGKSVPSNAVFTDTNTWRGITDSLTSTDSTISLSAKAGKNLQDSKANFTFKSVTVGTSATSTGLTAKSGAILVVNYNNIVRCIYQCTSTSSISEILYTTIAGSITINVSISSNIIYLKSNAYNYPAYLTYIS